MSHSALPAWVATECGAASLTLAGVAQLARDGGPISVAWAHRELARHRRARARAAGRLFGHPALRALSTAAARDAEWRRHVEEVHGPAERALSTAWAGYLDGAADRYCSRLAVELAGQRSIERIFDLEMLARILAADFETRTATAVGDLFGGIIRAGFDIAGDILGIEWNPKADVAEEEIGREIVLVLEPTRARVAEIVSTGVAEKQTIAEMQARLQADPVFAPARALTIARTESTRLISLGTDSAYNDAANEGVEFKKMWLAARFLGSPDAAVRPSHAALDGHSVMPGEEFTITIGDNIGKTARQPGLFGIPEEDINCRCASRPELIE